MRGEIPEEQDVRELVSPDGESHVRLIEDFDDGEINTTVIEHRIATTEIDPRDYLARQDPFYKLQQALDGPRRQEGITEGQRRFLREFGPRGSWTWLREAHVRRQLLERLGYSLGEELDQDDRSFVRRITYTTPTTERWQRIVALAHPKGDQPLSVRVFEGGTYGLSDATHAFITEGQIMIATQQSEKTHDLSEHAFGFALIGNEFMQRMKKRLGPIIERAQIEFELPSLFPSDGDEELIFADINAEQLDRPATAVLRDYWHVLDGLSTRLAYSALRETGPYSHAEIFAKDYRGALYEHSSAMLVPQGIIVPFSEQANLQMGEETQERLELLEEVALQLAHEN